MMEVAICPVDDCKAIVDIVLKSSDGVLIGAHQRNLEMFTEAFPIAGTAVVSDPVSLEETGEVLRLMLAYTHNTRLRSLDGISFTLLASLAEAVEKYMIYSAVEFCKIRMKLAIDDHPNEVFLYAVKHNYPDLADMTAKSTLRNPVWDFLSLIRDAGLPDDIAFRWFRYREHWMGVFQLAMVKLTSVQHNDSPKRPCLRWSPFLSYIVKEITKDLSKLDPLGDIVNKYSTSSESGCVTCRQSFKDLTIWANKRIEELPKYSEA